MENIESIAITNTDTGRVTQSQLETKFATLREEASERAAQHRLRMQRVAEASASTGTPRNEPKPLKAEHHDRKRAPAPSKPEAPATSAPNTKAQVARRARHNIDLIALWSVVAPSTITAVFAGVAMSAGNVPLAYAVMFICAWFAVTCGLAVSALRLFNTERFIKLHRASAPRLGMAAIACALISVLAVEAARLSITAIAAPAAQQMSAKKKPVVSAVRSTAFEKTSRLPSAPAVKVASAGSVHFPTTPAVISAEKDTTAAIAGAVDETVVSLPAPDPVADTEQAETVSKVAVSTHRRASDKLLGSISAKGKFVAHRSSSKWTGKGKRAKSRVAAGDQRNFLEKLFTVFRRL